MPSCLTCVCGFRSSYLQRTLPWPPQPCVLFHCYCCFSGCVFSEGWHINWLSLRAHIPFSVWYRISHWIHGYHPDGHVQKENLIYMSQIGWQVRTRMLLVSVLIPTHLLGRTDLNRTELWAWKGACWARLYLFSGWRVENELELMCSIFFLKDSLRGGYKYEIKLKGRTLLYL